ncbi:MAG: hypothetical protein FWC47_06740 [Oscillospiraceae bacterium]|nr:hypothetical protein [Oscillospiraceae bacterium]
MYMTRQEIIEKYDGYWVFMINCKEGEYGETIGGEVVIHSKNMNEALDGIEIYSNEENTLITYVGKPPYPLLLTMVQKNNTLEVSP